MYITLSLRAISLSFFFPSAERSKQEWFNRVRKPALAAQSARRCTQRERGVSEASTSTYIHMYDVGTPRNVDSLLPANKSLLKYHFFAPFSPPHRHGFPSSPAVASETMHEYKKYVSYYVHTYIM